MSEQAPLPDAPKATFSLADRNPDVLTCIANLSNDEVFTPPALANAMLNSLSDAWHARYGTTLWSDPSVTFLDPFTKSGVFLREITKRLVDGLAEEIPHLKTRVDHILTNQVYGIAITELTALLARRSVYCSKWANGPHSIAESLGSTAGNIWFERTEHEWQSGRCVYCRASQAAYERDGVSETHAYDFIHNGDTESRMAELFGDGMKFDVIVGNPPYQLDDGGFGSSAGPIYHQFVEKAKDLDPRLLCMVIPARWYAGGKGLADFRNQMLTSGGIRTLHDFPDTTDAFPGVNIRGGVCYFLWDREHKGETTVLTHEKGEVTSEATRPLLEPGLDAFIRYNEGVAILRKVIGVEAKQGQVSGGDDHLVLPSSKSFASLVSSRKPFGLDTKFKGRSVPHDGDLLIYRNRGVCYAGRDEVPSGVDLIDTVKLLVPYASPGSDDYPHLVLSRPILAGSGEAATETYLVVGPFESNEIALNVATYMGTQFFRFMLTLLRVSQHVTRNVYALVPIQDFSRAWLDDDLAERYGLTSQDRAFMDRFVKPVSWAEDYL